MTATIRNYATAGAIRTATDREVSHYVRCVSAMSGDQRAIGAVAGSAIANDLAGTVVYMDGVDIPAQPNDA